MPNIKQFFKKVEHLNFSWTLKKIDRLDNIEKRIFMSYGVSDFSNLVAFHFKDRYSWFIIATYGIYIFEKNSLKLIRYGQIVSMEIIMDLEEKYPERKRKANTLELKLQDGENLYLQCVDQGAVYSLYMIVSFGEWYAKKCYG
jgi:hypothetical protein